MTFVTEVHLDKKTTMTEEAKKKGSDLLEKMHKEDSKMVKGIFKNHEAPRAELTFSVRYYKGDPIRTYVLEDGEEYTIPLGVAKHINNQCKYSRHDWLVDQNGKKMQTSGRPTERYSFVSTEYQ